MCTCKTMVQFRDYCEDMIEKHPDKLEAISETYALAAAEVEDRESESQEVELGIQAIKELLEG